MYEKKLYDLDKIKEIQLQDICERYGISLQKKGNRFWGRLRANDKTPSFSIKVDKNLWYDFGLGKGGSPIELVSEIEGIERDKAINRLAEMYGIDGDKINGWSALTNSQYREIGIMPERATMNFNINLEKHSLEKVVYWNDKYGIPVSELAIKYPDVYNKMLNKKSIALINTLRNNYKDSISKYHKAEHNITKEVYLNLVKSYEKDINRKVELYQKALYKVNTDYSYFEVDSKKDLANKSFEADKEIFGDIRYKELKQLGEVGFKKLEERTALSLLENLKNENINYSAFKKENGQINIAFKKVDVKKVDCILKELINKKNKDIER